MFDGIQRRVVSLWFPRLASDRVLRQCPIEGPFALTLKQQNANRIYCLNAAATQHGLHQGMPYADARAFCPNLQSRVAQPEQDLRFLHTLRRWATRYCPWVGLEGEDGLAMDVTGSTHLFGGEAAMLSDIRMRLMRAGISVQVGLADTRGGAWALAHYGEGVAPSGEALSTLAPLPVAALRIEDSISVTLQRLGLRSIGDLAGAARAPLTRRFGPGLLSRLDQALGTRSEEISPYADPPHFAVRMTLPEPIGLLSDVMAGAERLIVQLCAKLKAQEMGARNLCITLHRVDQGHQQVELRLARPLRDPLRILPLFERGLSEVDAGYGIDLLRLEATRVEPLPEQQISHVSGDGKDKLDDLISRLGARIGLENIQRFLPADSHIPERSFIIAPAAYADPAGSWVRTQPRPITLFPPEPIAGTGARPPGQFRWRRMSLTTGRATGPERITPEWWLEDENWRSGMRDYWRVETREGRRLWLFYTPQNPGWFVQGEFA
ncbi:DNA polymerase Y family protein [Aliiroseovarius crassostreae]|uniref:Y-family DNA polymerase n=1 Tax=Aliiroseovarius crassostreae TaxID=154981 RepID=UPI0022030C43|nr:DNA polymerase Y family protein [Aliiroseovarius crassostreae]UWQ12291.1 DNA polymerase Y family protein [Aliiroseovarius crassostreae]